MHVGPGLSLGCRPEDMRFGLCELPAHSCSECSECSYRCGDSGCMRSRNHSASE